MGLPFDIETLCSINLGIILALRVRLLGFFGKTNRDF